MKGTTGRSASVPDRPCPERCSKCFFSIYTLGIVALILVVIFWVGSGFFTQEILSSYYKPFLMACMTNVSFMTYFVFLFAKDPVNILMRKRAEEERQKQKELHALDASPTNGGSSSLHGEEEGSIGKRSNDKVDQPLAPLSTIELAKIALIFFPLYLGANYTMNVAFGTTSVGSASILAATCGFFTLIFGWIVGVEVLSFSRIMAVVVAVGGVFILGIPEFYKEESHTLGNVMALLSSILYGVYSVYIKRASIDESRLSMPLLFAFSGLYTLLMSWPLILALHYLGQEAFGLPTSGQVWAFLIFNIIFGGLVPNYLWNVAFVCTSPLVVAIGLSVNIPLTLLVEFFLMDMAFFSYRLWSGLCVVAGFLILNLANIYPEIDIAIERYFVRKGWMKKEDVQKTEERAEQVRKSEI